MVGGVMPRRLMSRKSVLLWIPSSLAARTRLPRQRIPDGLRIDGGPGIADVEGMILRP